MSLMKVFTAFSLFISLSNAACCLSHTDSATCSEEIGTAEACVWLDDNNELFTSGDSGGAQCVSAKWVLCQTDGICPPPKKGVDPDCTLSVCTNNHYVANVAMVLDESGSVGKTNYLYSLDFVQKMVDYDINTVSPTAVLAFGSSLDPVHTFTTNKASLDAAIAAERLNYNGGGTCLHLPIANLITEYTNQFDPSDNNLLFVMTDGAPNCGWSDSVCDSYKAQLDAAGVTVYVVGIGSGFYQKAVECLVDDDSYILRLKDFDPKNFYKLESLLRLKVCPTVFEEDEEAMLIAQNAELQRQAIISMKEYDGISSHPEAQLARKDVVVNGNSQIFQYNQHTFLWIASIMATIIMLSVCFRNSLCSKSELNEKLNLNLMSNAEYDAI